MAAVVVVVVLPVHKCSVYKCVAVYKGVPLRHVTMYYVISIGLL